jgi:hypothetical protein
MINASMFSCKSKETNVTVAKAIVVFCQNRLVQHTLRTSPTSGKNRNLAGNKTKKGLASLQALHFVAP